MKPQPFIKARGYDRRGGPIPKVMGGSPLPVAKPLHLARRPELLQYYEHCKSVEHEWLRRQIVEHNRVDVLAIAVLGYEVKPFHLAMLRWQFEHPDSMQLVFRGAGKSTLCTVAKCIHYLIKNRDLRILLASKTTGNAQSFLKEIKTHLEENRLLVELFGEFYDPRKVNKWDTTEIEIVGRTTKAKESTITCTGVDSTLVSKHFDVIIADDLIDEDNSRSKHMRDRARTWYYQILDPCLEPPDPEVPHRGDFHRLGTRYHYDDLYGHLQSNELADHTQVIPALDEQGRSPWPEKYAPSWFEEKRVKSGTIIFRAQYQCDTEAQKGEIFQYDDCQIIDDKMFPKTRDLRVFMGVDLAISTQDKNDLFAIVVIGVNKAHEVYALDYFDGHLRFGDQTRTIVRYYKKWDPIRAAVEVNAYQAAQYHNLSDEHPGVRVLPVFQDKDKITRAWKLSPRFENKQVFFRRVQGRLIDQLVLFPNFRFKDGFDALDLAVRASKMRKKRRGDRREEPGIL